MTDTTTEDANIDLIRDKINEGSITLTIKSLPMGGGKQPTFKQDDSGFTMTTEEKDAMNAIANRYADTLIEIDDIDKKYEGIKRFWEIGGAIAHAEEIDDNITRAELVDMLHIDGLSSTQARRCVKVYEMFPEEGFNDEHTYTLITELAVRSESLEDARQAYFRMDDAGFSLTQYEARAWGHVTEPTLEDIATQVAQYVDTSRETQIRGVTRLLSVYGIPEDEHPPEDEIRKALEDAE